MTAVSERLTAALSDRYRIEAELGRGGMATVRFLMLGAGASTTAQTIPVVLVENFLVELATKVPRR